MPTRDLNVRITGDSASLRRAFESADRSAAKFGRSAKQTSKDTDHLTASFTRAGDAMGALRDAAGQIKFPALIAGAGAAVQGISALAGGAVALTSALAPLSGAIAAYPALGAAAAQGLGVFKLATDGLAVGIKAANKGGKEYRKWLKDATPAQRDFVKSLQPTIKEFHNFRDVAQETALPGFTKGIQLATRNVDAFRPIVRETAGVLGDLAKEAGRMFGGRAWTRDIQTVGGNNVKIIERFGHVGLNLANVLRDVVVEAQPLVLWMSRVAERLSENVERAAATGRETGKLRDFFKETKDVMKDVASIGGDLAMAFYNIARQGKPLGDEVLGNIVKLADKFREWTESARGRNQIRKYFEDIHDPLMEAGRLVEAIGGSFIRLGRGKGLTQLLRTIRVDLVPSLEQVVGSTTNAFGPHVIKLIGTMADTFSHLGGSSGPLIAFVDVLDTALTTLNKLIDAVPGLGTALATVAGGASLVKALQLTAALSGVGKLNKLLRGTTALAAGEAVAEGVAGGTAAKAATKGAGKGILAGGVGRLLAATPGPVKLAAAVAVSPAIIERITTDAKSMGEAVEDATAKARKAAHGNSLLIIKSLRAEAAAARQTGVDIDRDYADKLDRVADKAESRWKRHVARMTGERHADSEDTRKVNIAVSASYGQLARQTDLKMSDIMRSVRGNTQLIKRDLGKNTEEGKRALSENFRQAAKATATHMGTTVDAIKSAMRRGETLTDRGSKRIRDLLVKGLMSLGLSQNQANAKLTTGTLQNTDDRPNANTFRGSTNARGGAVTRVPGYGRDDSVGLSLQGRMSAIVAPGEDVIVANRHQRPLLDAAVQSTFGVGGLEDFFSRFNRPHYAARGGVLPGYAPGGIVPVPGFPGERAAASAIPMIELIARRFGLVLTDAFGAGHESPGHTVTGTAADFAGSDAAMDKAVRFLTRRGYLVGYDGRYGSQDWPGHGPAAGQGGSNAHLHVELGSRGAVAAAIDPPTIHGPRTGLRDAIGAMVNRAMGVQEGTANQVAKRVAAQMFTAPVAGGGGGGFSKAQLSRLWVQAGGPRDKAGLMAAIALAESGGRARAHNPSGASGLWQILGNPFPGDPFDPLTNAKMAVSKYRSQGLGAWEAYTNGAYRRFLNRGGILPGLDSGTGSLRNLIARFSPGFGGHDRGLRSSHQAGRPSTRLGVTDRSGYLAGFAGNSRDLLSGLLQYVGEPHRRASKALRGGGGAGTDPSVATAPREKRVLLNNMIRRGDSIASRQTGYVYGGGHSGFSTSARGYDCSGYVSNILGRNVISSPMAVRQPLQSHLRRGPGKWVTVGIRGTSGQNAHTMIRVGNRYYESGGHHGAARVRGWNGAFDFFHPQSLQRGGIVRATSGHPGLRKRRRDWVHDTQRGMRWADRHPGVAEDMDPTGGNQVDQVLSRLLSGPVGTGDVRAAMRVVADEDVGTRGVRRVLKTLSQQLPSYKGGYNSLLRLTRRARLRAEDATGVQRKGLVGTASLIEGEYGRRLRRGVGAIDRREGGFDRADTNLRNQQILRGLDPESGQGLQETISHEESQLAIMRGDRKELRKLLRKAEKTGNRKLARALRQRLTQLDDDILGQKADIYGLKNTPATDSGPDVAAILGELKTAIDDLNATYKADMAVRSRIAASQDGQLARGFADFVSGQIAGTAGLGARTSTFAGVRSNRYY